MQTLASSGVFHHQTSVAGSREGPHARGEGEHEDCDTDQHGHHNHPDTHATQLKYGPEIHGKTRTMHFQDGIR